MLVLGPHIDAVSVPQMMEQLNSVSGGVPMFGTLACSHNLKQTENHTIWNGQAYKNTIVLLLMYGDVKPSFFITAIADGNIQTQKSEITDSDGCLLKHVDGMPILDYLVSRGISRNTILEAPASVPLMIDYMDGSQAVALGMYYLTPERYAQCVGEVPIGAKLTIGKQDYNGIMETAEHTIQLAIAEAEKRNGSILMFPCNSRYLMLAPNSEDEMQKAVGMIGSRAPYHICYSGGEICPVYDSDGKLMNRIHNFTYIACVF
jgi:hypothetical protein